MTREEAIAKVRKTWDGPPRSAAENEVDLLVALGLLKLDTPEAVHEEGIAFIAQMAIHWHNHPHAIAEDLALARFKIVRAE